ncbi:MAG: M20/M25/M40 family metallo-hydrolase [Deltaproteobacteria bacterium]|jgi:glutamate carboxypeptidase|nr:M20/M25/M40 family metallo-hydrolase [Deltaproteobacteria bacterium]
MKKPMNIEGTLDSIKGKAEYFLDEQLGLLETLVSFDSGTGNLEGNLRVVETLVPLLSPMAETIERLEVPGVGIHLVCRVGKVGAERKILCLAHLDTVFEEGDSGENPFRIVGDRVYGLGVVDCKAGVVVSLYGLKIAHELGLIPDDLEIIVIYNCDEETGSRSTRPILESEASKAQLAFVFEPSRDPEIIGAHLRGVAYGNIKAVAKGVKVTISSAKESNADLAISRILTSLESHNDPARGIYFYSFAYAGEPVKDEDDEISLTDLLDGENPAKGPKGSSGGGSGRGQGSGPNSGHGSGASGGAVRGLIGGTPKGGFWDFPFERLEAEADFLATFETDEGLKYVRQTLDKIGSSVWVPSCQVNTALKISRPSEEKNKNTLKAVNVVKKAGRRLGLELNEEKHLGVSDGSWCSFYGLSTIDALGPSMYDIHTKREALSLRTIVERTQLFALSIALLEKDFFNA